MSDTQATAGELDAPATSASAGGTSALLRWGWLVLALVGALAGAAGSEVIARTNDLYRVDPARMGMPPYPPEIERELWHYALLNHAVGFAGLGFVICGLLALALVALRASPARALGALALGAALGALLGAAGGAGAFWIDATLATVSIDGLFKAVMIHLPNWLLLATVLAVVAAVLVRPRPRAKELLVAVLAAGIGAAVLYPVLGLVCFPAAHSDRAVPFLTGVRVLCFAVGGAALGMAAARWLRSPSVAAPAHVA